MANHRQPVTRPPVTFSQFVKEMVMRLWKQLCDMFKAAKPKRQQTRRTFLEPLETRRVMATYLQGGLLYITGGNTADTASIVDTTPQNNQGALIVNVNGTASVFPEVAVNGIRFYGYGGNDTLSNATVKPVVAYGGTGNDTLNGGGASDTLHGESGNDNLFGYGGHDTMYGSTGDDEMHGGSGNDTMQGGDDDDEMYGDSGNDAMYGQGGQDVLFGGVGDDNVQGGTLNDTLYGEAGDDFMTGQEGNDTLYGGDDDDEMYGYTGDDTLRGGDGNDMLGGWIGNDRLFGEEGNDDLYGQDGRDGLFGGNGADSVSGGADSDRFLVIGDEAEVSGESTSDAFIRFGGPKAWSYTEILRVDLGLGRMHNRTGNTVLLKDPDVPYNAGDPDAPRLTFLRKETDFDVNGEPWGNVGTNHGNGTISLYDSLFSGNPSNGIDNKVAQYVIHEVGHNWDSASENTMREHDESQRRERGRLLPQLLDVGAARQRRAGDAAEPRRRDLRQGGQHEQREHLVVSPGDDVRD
jgi:hypothetical protein